MSFVKLAGPGIYCMLVISVFNCLNYFRKGNFIAYWHTSDQVYDGLRQPLYQYFQRSGFSLIVTITYFSKKGKVLAAFSKILFKSEGYLEIRKVMKI